MNPGSDGARFMGCKCDPVANAAGCGDYMALIVNGGVRFVVDSACPIHGTSSWMTPAARMGMPFRYVPDPTLPDGEVQFKVDGKLVGRLTP